MTAAYFEDHPTDPEKVILRKPPLDQGADYERGFIDGMQKQMQSSVDISTPCKSAGGYRMGEITFSLPKKPRWIHRIGVRLVLGWKWVDA